jgi:predicted enzyme related to lactoylglutathione lyase
VIKEIAFTVYPAKDVRALREWYERHLGLTFSGEYAEDGVEKYNETTIGGTTFALMTPQWVEREPGTAGSVVFEVDDIDAEVAKLRKTGVTVEDPYATPVCKIAGFQDGEGNKVAFHQVTVQH